jgi:hypothetical protein
VPVGADAEDVEHRVAELVGVGGAPAWPEPPASGLDRPGDQRLRTMVFVLALGGTQRSSPYQRWISDQSSSIGPISS